MHSLFEWESSRDESLRKTGMTENDCIIGRYWRAGLRKHYKISRLITVTDLFDSHQLRAPLRFLIDHLQAPGCCQVWKWKKVRKLKLDCNWHTPIPHPHVDVSIFFSREYYKTLTVTSVVQLFSILFFVSILIWCAGRTKFQNICWLFCM